MQPGHWHGLDRQGGPSPLRRKLEETRRGVRTGVDERNEEEEEQRTERDDADSGPRRRHGGGGTAAAEGTLASSSAGNWQMMSVLQLDAVSSADIAFCPPLDFPLKCRA